MMSLANITTGKIFEALFFSFFLCNIAAIYCTKFARKTGLLDRPHSEPHKINSRTVPLSGGPALFLTMLVTVFFFRNSLSRELLGLCLSSLIVFGFALWDDYVNLNWKIKMLGQFIAAGVLIFSGTRTHLFDSSFFVPLLNFRMRIVLDIALTFFWVVFITNAFNLVDSTDGLMLGLSSWALGFFILATADSGQSDLALLCSLMLGGCIALLFYNSFPAFLFMGDSGAQTVGFILSSIAIRYTPPELLQGNTWFMPILLLGIPIFDSVLVIISRWRKGQRFYRSGTDHTFHRLLKMGFSKIQASLLMQSLCFAIQILAFFAISKSVLEANLIFAFIVLVGIALIIFLENESLWKIIKLPQKDISDDMF